MVFESTCWPHVAMLRPPPGNNGGGVSGAGPRPPAVEAQSNTTSASHRPLSYPIRLRNLTSFPSSEDDNDSKHTNAYSRETTGGQTRCEKGRAADEWKSGGAR